MRRREQLLAGLLAIGRILAEAQEEHSLEPMAESVIVRAFGRQARKILLDHAEAFLRALILRGLRDVVLRLLALGLHVELPRAEGLLDEAQTSHGDARAIDVAQLQPVQGLIGRGVDAIGRTWTIRLGVAVGKSRERRIGDRETRSLFFFAEGGFDLLEYPTAFLQLALGTQSGTGVEIPN